MRKQTNKSKNLTKKEFREKTKKRNYKLFVEKYSSNIRRQIIRHV